MTSDAVQEFDPVHNPSFKKFAARTLANYCELADSCHKAGNYDTAILEAENLLGKKAGKELFGWWKNNNNAPNVSCPGFPPLLLKALIKKSKEWVSEEEFDEGFEKYANKVLVEYFGKFFAGGVDWKGAENEFDAQAATSLYGYLHHCLVTTTAAKIDDPYCPALFKEALLKKYKSNSNGHVVPVANDLLNENYETLDVTAIPIAIDSPIGTPVFEAKVIGILCEGLKHGYKYIASGWITKLLKIDKRDFEKWADSNPKLIRKDGVSPGVYYYTLAKTMTAHAIGTTEFDAQLTVILTEDDKPWKSTAYLAKALEVDETEFIAWADKSPALVRRFSPKKEGIIYYALSNRIVEKKEEKKSENTQKVLPLSSSITVEEFLSLGMLHEISANLIRVMEHYGNRLAVRHADAFAYLTRAEKELRNGIVLMRDGLKVKDKQLPSVDDL